jgi:pyruvate dehydrogenase E1 component
MDVLLYYKEAKEGQILEEGITEAGSISSFIAAGSAYATHGINTIPFFIYYSMFGMQRVGDLVWAAADTRTRGFLLGGTAGRTTLSGEGLQHQDGHSHLLSLAVPNLISYDPAFAYEIAVIIEDGIRRIGRRQRFYYLTLMNENYEIPPMPDRNARYSQSLQLRASSKKGHGEAQLAAGDPQQWSPHSRYSKRSTTCRPTSGASRAIRSSIATAMPWTVGTACTRVLRRACPMSRSVWATPTACSWRRPTT